MRFVPLGRRWWIVVCSFGLRQYEPVPFLDEDRSRVLWAGFDGRSFCFGVRIRLISVPADMAPDGDRHEERESFLPFLDRPAELLPPTGRAPSTDGRKRAGRAGSRGPGIGKAPRVDCRASSSKSAGKRREGCPDPGLRKGAASPKR